MKRLRGFVFFVAVALIAALATEPAEAAKRSKRKVHYVNRDASIIVEASSGKVIQASKANEIRHPASLTKMMTLYLTFEALEKKKLRLAERLSVSPFAARQSPTNLNLEPGDTLTVEEAIKALVVRSANDAAVVMAEKLGGNEKRFASLMTDKARALNMKKTRFTNASGLPDARQVTTARDMATLAIALKRHFPQYYSYFNTREFTYNGTTYTTHNHVLQRYPYADGLKTGYVRMSGFNLATSAKKEGHELIGVVLGGNTVRERDDRMIALLDDAFDRMQDGTPIHSVAALVTVPGGKTQKIIEVASAEPAVLETQEALIAPQEYAAIADAAMAQGDIEEPGSTKPAWGIQVGVFGAAKDALMAALHAQEAAKDVLGSAKVKVAKGRSKEPIHRARIENISEKQARNACQALLQKRESCFVYRMGAV